MARKIQSLVIPHDNNNRDSGKIFILTEMPARRVEVWAQKLIFILSKSGVEIPDNLRDAGIYGVFVMGMHMLANSSIEELQPLLDEMLTCVRLQPDKAHPEFTRDLIEDDIEEVKTLLILRAKILELHTGFSIPGVLPTSSTSTPRTPGDSQQPRIPRARSRHVSPPGVQR